MSHFLAYDVGTSSVKSILVDKAGTIIAAAIEEYPLYMPRPGWAEQEPQDYWEAVCKTTRKMMADTQIALKDIKGISFTTQAMGLIPVDKSGNVLHRNISWVDGRAEKQSRRIMNRFGGKKLIQLIVGVALMGKDVIPKMLWLKENRPDIFNNTYKFLDVNGYLRYKCTGKMMTEWSGACSYSFSVKKKDWERLFFNLTGAGTDKLPDLIRSIDEAGKLTVQAAQEMGLCEGISVYGGCDDTQSAALGTTATEEGEAHIYVGTSAWVGVATAKDRGFKNSAMTMQSANPDMNLVLGITESAGVNTEWLLSTFYSHEKSTLPPAAVYELMENEIKQTPAGAEYLILTPWFLGERCPVSSTTTRSTIFNLSHQHTRGHIARAHFEGIAYNLRWTIENFEKDFGFDIRELKIAGGGCFNKTWMQIIADITQRKIITTSQPKNAGALGAAMCAMVGSGTCKSFNDIQQLIHTTAAYTPHPANKEIYNLLFGKYKSVFHQLRKTYDGVNSARFEIQ